MGGELWAGTSGWSYENWRDDFYAGVPRRRWLEHYAARFPAVEVNATFYHRMRPGALARWREQTPAGFRFALKGSRYLTHVRRLAPQPDEMARERTQFAELGDKLLAVLWQLPAALHCDLPRLEAFLRLLEGWPARHAIEFRHESWFCDAVARRLGRRQVAACMSDAADWPLWDIVTADFAYVRLHGHQRTYHSAYGEAGLRPWARRVQAWRDAGCDVHVFLDNTDAGHAWRDARRLLELCGGAGTTGSSRKDCGPL